MLSVLFLSFGLWLKVRRCLAGACHTVCRASGFSPPTELSAPSFEDTDR